MVSAVANYQIALKQLDELRKRVSTVAADLKATGQRLMDNPVGMMGADGRVDLFKGSPLSTISTADLESLLKEYFGQIVLAQKLYKSIPDEERGAVVQPPAK